MSRKKNKSKEYQDSLINNPYWNEVKRNIKLRDNFHCQICGSATNLDVHHITYVVDSKSIINDELRHLDWLILLCRKCHDSVHANNCHALHPGNRSKLSAPKFKQLKCS